MSSESGSGSGSGSGSHKGQNREIDKESYKKLITQTLYSKKLESE